MPTDEWGSVLLEAIACLSEASGRLAELDREPLAHRCDAIVARLQSVAYYDAEEVEE